MSTLRVLAQDYFEAFTERQPGQFRKAVKHVLKTCRFFPKIADIETALQEIQHDAPKSNAVALLDERSWFKTDEEIATGKRNLEIIRDMLLKKITMEEAEKRITTFSGTH